jgi:endonuclease/exonuclease/phosphatase family metal-dependent hydrolase
MKRPGHFSKFLCVLVVLSFSLAPLAVVKGQGIAGPPVLNFADLAALYNEDIPSTDLQSKLTRLLTTPFVNNMVAPTRSGGRNGSNGIRVAAWNIERGLQYEAVKAALTNDQQYFRRLTPAARHANFNLQTVLAEAAQLSQADVVVLNEADWGVKRTDYRYVAKELATATRMNYAFGVEFVEVDPLTLGTETLEGETSTDKPAMLKNLTVDKSRTLGLHGTAILSRFPLKNVRVVRFVNQGHDWYTAEKHGVSKLEKGKRKGAGLVFGEKIVREVRRGGRMMLLADIENPSFPGRVVTVVATHLESRAKPAARLKQLEEVLSVIKRIENPVVLAGDMNTSGSDATPTSFQREVKRRLGSSTFWATQGIKYATGVGLLYDLANWTIKNQRLKNDPTVKSVKFVSENPEEKFFSTLKDFRFMDGGSFDFRGSKQHSVGASEQTLSDSNERASKGFVTTMELDGKFKVGLKLDWIFVKPARLTDPEDRDQSYLFAPKLGRTLKGLNYALKDRISDHNPILVDLLTTETPR